MELRSPVTAIPVLGGLLAGVTVTVNNVELPATTVEGFAFPEPARANGEGDTVSDIDVEAVLACASVTPIGKDFPPEAVAAFNVA